MSQEQQKEQEPLGTLFGILAYNEVSELEAYLDRIRSKSTTDVLLTIHSALRYAQMKGAYSFEESEAVSIALRNLQEAMKNKVPNT